MYVQEYRIYAENTEIPNSPKAPKITNNITTDIFEKEAFAGATCFIDEPAAPAPAPAHTTVCDDIAAMYAQATGMYDQA